MELISILMPAYNAGKYIEASILSVLKQSYTDWELIIINDGSTDNTKEIVERYSKEDSRIKLINQVNQKMAAARNNGIKNSKGAWIAFLDSDDLWEPEKLSLQIQASKEYPTAGVIYSDGFIFNDHEQFNNLMPYPTFTGRLLSHDIMYQMQYQQNYIPVLSVIVKRSLVDTIGPQNEERVFSGCEDWDYWLRIARVGADFYGLPQKLFYYRRHETNVSKNSVNMLLAQLAVFTKNYEPGLINSGDLSNALKKVFFPLINNLIKLRRFDDAYFAIKETDEILPSITFKTIKFLIKSFGRLAHIPVAIIGRLESLQLK
ncbi:glycosyltransferase family 2 protein [Mucilaginibacter endophyticus]|uniref:glycosyltransferase family 2 protein n=1 Tax=Mucilaginibacter endophyticus TaxID=2675003 RepID=UPI000E0CEBF9|nr:glycosyltransferase [Mucilaginibacter endophyticus]